MARGKRDEETGKDKARKGAVFGRRVKDAIKDADPERPGESSGADKPGQGKGKPGGKTWCTRSSCSTWGAASTSPSAAPA